MEEVSKLRVAYNYLNYIRTLPVYLSISASAHKALLEMDFTRWWEICTPQMDPRSAKSRFSALNWRLLNKPEYRSLLLHRFRKPPKALRSVAHFLVTRLLWKPPSLPETICPVSRACSRPSSRSASKARSCSP